MKLRSLLQIRYLWRRFRHDPEPKLANSSSASISPASCENTKMEIAFDALYKDQALDRKTDFRGKRKQIEKRYNDFWGQQTARADVEAYMNSEQEPNYGYLDAGEKMPTLHGNRLANPADKRLAEGGGFFIIGVANAFDVALYHETPGRSAMSIVHLLAIPEARIFNGVSLTHQDVPTVEAMIDLFKEQWQSSRKFKESVLEEQWKAMERRRKELANKDEVEGTSHAEAAFARAKEHYNRLAPMVLDGLTVDDFQFGLHLYPDQSQPHLHVHIVAAREDCRQYSTSKHDEKTVDAHEVLDFIRSPAAAVPWTSSRRAK